MISVGFRQPTSDPFSLKDRWGMQYESLMCNGCECDLPLPQMIQVQADITEGIYYADDIV